MIINGRDDKDYVCLLYGNRWMGYKLCYGDEHCEKYEPDIKENK